MLGLALPFLGLTPSSQPEHLQMLQGEFRAEFHLPLHDASGWPHLLTLQWLCSLAGPAPISVPSALCLAVPTFISGVLGSPEQGQARSTKATTHRAKGYARHVLSTLHNLFP